MYTRKVSQPFLFGLVCLFLLSSNVLSAQLLNHRQGQVLVQLQPNETANRFAERLQQFNGRTTRLQADREVSDPLHIWQFSFDWTTIAEQDFLAFIRRQPQVISAQFNHLVEMRSTIPDDAAFDNQWQHLNTGQSGGTPGADMDSDLAWDITTGGLTANGDTIVVAILDNGVNLNHEDLIANLWRNHTEIPGNGIDDDNNGYVDDYLGWNSENGTDEVGTGGNHGTPVAGIVGAKGNNGIGVAGVNWDVKLMIIKNNFNTDEAAVLAAYSYALVQRMRYNASNGAEGAFVVATNASWGADFGQPEDSPLWCSFYDTLGVHGIISCGATINGDVDVDVDGDLPTACPSDFLIAVTNINDDDNKVNQAGFGLTTIDLGAHGAGAYTTSVGGGYGGFGGTSGATPEVCGAVALLYSAPCPELIDIAMSDPAAAAILVRQAILDGVDTLSNLEGLTVTGGRLDLRRSLDTLLVSCGSCLPPSVPQVLSATDDVAEISWNTNLQLEQVDLRYRLLGDTTWVLRESVTSPTQIGGLQGCSTYEYQLLGYCESDTAATTNSFLFDTDGCCELPESFRAEVLDSSSISLNWDNVLAADNYLIRYRPSGMTDWIEVSNFDTDLILNGLDDCTEYEIQIQTDCDTSATNFSDSQFLRTLNCGFCLDTEYCFPIETITNEEWIGYIKIGDQIENQTNANSDNGYGNYANIDMPLPAYERGFSYPITLVPEFADDTFSENFAIFLDLDGNGDFGMEEIIFSIEGVSDTVFGEINIPITTVLGENRLRVLMNFETIDDACPGPDTNYGEIEDFCIEVLEATSCLVPTSIDTSMVRNDSILLEWMGTVTSTTYDLRYRPTAGGDWIEVSTENTSLSLSGLVFCTEYEVEMRTNCGGTQTDYTPLLVFTSSCITNINDPLADRYWQVFPNPTYDRLQLRWSDAASFNEKAQLSLISIDGSVLQLSNWNGQDTALSLANLPAGIYYLRLERPGFLPAIKRVVKMR